MQNSFYMIRISSFVYLKLNLLLIAHETQPNPANLFTQNSQIVMSKNQSAIFLRDYFHLIF